MRDGPAEQGEARKTAPVTASVRAGAPFGAERIEMSYKSPFKGLGVKKVEMSYDPQGLNDMCYRIQFNFCGNVFETTKFMTQAKALEVNAAMSQWIAKFQKPSPS